MSKSTHIEDLSCLMDGELSDDQARFLIRRLTHDSELRGTWARWHQSRDTAAGIPVQGIHSLAADVSRALEQDAAPSPARTSNQQQHRWLKPAAGLGVAAAVAALALNLANQTEQPDPSAAALLAESQPGVMTVPDATPAFPTNVSATTVSSSMTEEYLMRHNAVSPTRRGQGLVDYRWIVVRPVKRNTTTELPERTTTERPEQVDEISR